MHVLIIDNYDSFTFNLVQAIQTLGATTSVHRNDEIDCSALSSLSPSHIIISPGPGRPSNAGLSKTIIETFYRSIPILGVCLGHQAIGEVFGGLVNHAPRQMHGKQSAVYHTHSDLFQNIPNPFPAARYHSLILEPKSVPDTLNVTAHTEQGEIMAIEHTTYPLAGIQFHPESILTPHGPTIIENFLTAYHPNKNRTENATTIRSISSIHPM